MANSSLLETRVRWLEQFSWEIIVQLNKTLCSNKANVAHGLTANAAQLQKEWNQIQLEKLSVFELLDFLRHCHKSAPFLNFNGNVFSELGRRILELALSGMAVTRLESTASLAAHYVAGVLDREIAVQGLTDLLNADLLEPGDRVTTLKKSRQGIIIEVRPDGRVVWKPDGSHSHLIATTDTLIKLFKKKPDSRK